MTSLHLVIRSNLTSLAARHASASFPRQSHKSSRSPRGQSLVEFALASTFLILLMMGVIDFGIAFVTWITLRDAAEEGATYGALYATSCDSHLIDRVHYASVTTPILGGDITRAVVTVARTGDGSPGNTVTVKVSYDYIMINPFVFPATLPISTSDTQTILNASTSCS